METLRCNPRSGPLKTRKEPPCPHGRGEPAAGDDMAILSKMYFNAVFGALGGLLGWMLFGVLGERLPQNNDLNLLLGGAIIGGCIGYFVVSVEAIRDRSLVRFARLAS